MKKYAILHTLGCRLNSADSALLVDRLEKAGYSVVQSADSVDLVVVNSCTVTAEAARKSRQAVRKFRASYPGALIVVTGCSAELDRDAYLKDGAASVVLSNPEKRGISELILDYLAGRHELGGKAASLNEPVQAFHEEAISRFPFRSRAFLKIQEGCNNFCSYCIVPYARGPERSRSFDEVLADCRQAVAAGYPELVLTGVNTCAYFDAGRDLGALVREVCRIDGNFRVRLSSTEPHPHNIGLLEALYTPQLRDSFARAQEILHQARTIYIAGMRSSYATAYYLAFMLQQMCDNVHLLTTSTSDLPTALSDVRPEDCLLVISYARYTSSSYDIVSHFHRAGCKIVALTDSLTSPIALKATEVLIAPNGGNFSPVGAITLCNCFITSLGRLNAQQTLERMELQDKIALEHHIYL